MVIDFYDTSALLSYENPENLFSNGLNYVSHFVLSELEDIKNNSSKDENIKARARKVSRFFLSNPEGFMCSNFKIQDIEKIRKKYSYLPNNIDGLILAEARLLKEKKKEYNIYFHTADINMYLFANKLFDYVAIVESNKHIQEPWAGYGKYYPNPEQMTMLYSDPKINCLQAAINEYCLIYQNNEMVDILRWTGEKYVQLKYGNFRNTFLGTQVKPLNLQQKMAFDLLQNPNITVKILTGVPGGGKDYIQFLHALDMVYKGIFKKIVYIRNLIPFKDAPEVGFLKGDLAEKTEWGLGPVKSIMGEEGLNSLIEQGLIENLNLMVLRGLSFTDSLVYVSEGQNITGSGYKLLVSRCGKGSQIWINGDYKQTDLDKFNKDNGLVRVTNSLKGNKLFGTVKLTESERSETAELAAII